MVIGIHKIKAQEKRLLMIYFNKYQAHTTFKEVLKLREKELGFPSWSNA